MAHILFLYEESEKNGPVVIWRPSDSRSWGIYRNWLLKMNIYWFIWLSRLLTFDSKTSFSFSIAWHLLLESWRSFPSDLTESFKLLKKQSNFFKYFLKGRVRLIFISNLTCYYHDWAFLVHCLLMTIHSFENLTFGHILAVLNLFDWQFFKKQCKF